ncbi:helix-turn-helix domain-containing protein [Mucilaginibacter galii]|uniref:Helix-turn-helix domain-containing protein n=1 Tax=Mucilaginibacter galii TaxID=2005073 RepID=A0A917J8T8_9SPHI|nr:helix-turn-helix domain-containing protein [Mucilaginibacter galii]GGI50784.1 hypothetical protein GCM10011425_19960 [Mucilaginibacter galii]
MSPDELLTKKDLENFKKELFDFFKPLMGVQGLSKQKWLRSRDVCTMLQISSGTLQTLRITGKLTAHKAGNIFFYKPEDIEKMLAGDQKKSPKRN